MNLQFYFNPKRLPLDSQELKDQWSVYGWSPAVASWMHVVRGCFFGIIQRWDPSEHCLREGIDVPPPSQPWLFTPQERKDLEGTLKIFRKEVRKAKAGEPKMKNKPGKTRKKL